MKASLHREHFVAYLRVSTPYQSVTGTSLSEQRLAISEYAVRHNIRVQWWYTETASAASRGRPVFRELLKVLSAGRATGVIIHKLDRSTRNLFDWAWLGELLDSGTDIRFVQDDLDLHSRGGRLAADIQAVIAADYVRNLREETRKGILGRFRQGIYPLQAPLGYVNNGRGKVKTLDAEAAPLIVGAFLSYAGGICTLRDLRLDTFMKGLRNRNGRPVSINGWSRILKNPFYAGILRLRSTGEEFQGKHQPLVSLECFENVQQALRARARRRTPMKHYFRYRRLLRCRGCSRALVGERQKGRVYYRCHALICKGVSVREDRVEEALAQGHVLMRCTPKFERP